MTSRGILKLGDFGIARVLSNTRSKPQTTVGTPYYLSPEIIKSQSYDAKSDIWSLGVILYEMAALKRPFSASTLPKLVKRITNSNFTALPSHFSDTLKDLITICLQKDPKDRPTIHEILRTPEISNRIQKYLEGDALKAEFEHTILHNQNVFEEYKK
jgi:NIMA (never in mitosis gene a)-related kinase 1/4/5